MMTSVSADQIAGWDAELSELTGSLGYLFNRPEPRVVFAEELSHWSVVAEVSEDARDSIESICGNLHYRGCVCSATMLRPPEGEA